MLLLGLARVLILTVLTAFMGDLEISSRLQGFSLRPDGFHTACLDVDLEVWALYTGPEITR